MQEITVKFHLKKSGQHAVNALQAQKTGDVIEERFEALSEAALLRGATCCQYIATL